ncbi:MAG: helicase-related protein [Candidatus Paceibacterota bacterium]
MDTDLTFITNEKEHNLLERFKVLIGKDTQFFDALVGYFYTSGFYKLYPSLEDTEKIRILIGLKTDRKTFDMLQEAKTQNKFDFSHAETKDQFSNAVADELEHSEDKKEVEDGVHKFIEWVKSGKLEVRAFPSEKIHAKLYIMSFEEGGRDKGRVITGSSNFSESGFVDNLEFNVELKNRSDYEFAKNKFNELWEDSVDVSEKYVETVNNRTWLNNTISPYELYLKFLYEYFKEKINLDQASVYRKYLPEEFLDLEYQTEAIKDAKSKLDAYGGVFISDVVGLGKTYISAMLAQQLDGRSLVLAPPVLLDKDNPGSWRNVFFDFKVSAEFESIGKLDAIIKRGTDKYENVFIDEAHRFRSESNETYEKLAQICRGKRVVLVTATPLNNTPKDILSQIKLFQKARNSTIPAVRDLESFFNGLDKKLKKLDRQKDYEKYMKAVQENANEIREKVLKHLMVRRTRTEILKYFGDDLKKQKLRFPEVENPTPVFYELDKNEDRAFMQTIELIANKFKYARYTPMLYYTGEITQPEKLAQQNMGKFMKILLVKRLESSFYAFENSLKRFVRSYEQFIEEYENGNVYVSKKYTNKIFEFLEDDNEEAVQKLVEDDKAEHYKAEDFRKDFKKDLESDLAVLKEIAELWKTVTRDPKLLKFVDTLRSEKVLKENKIIIFTESKETAQYLDKNLSKHFPNEVLSFTGGSGAPTREKVIENFDAKARFPKNDYRILVATEVLAEGVNLHRSNVVINYDIPWNPTRIMQRVGRINRVDTKFDKIYSYNFFPTVQANDQIKLREAAEMKIRSFIEMLGTDARLLTEGEEVKSHDLYTRLTTKETITGEDQEEDSELKYLYVIREIRDKRPDLFEKIKQLPKKARTAKQTDSRSDALLTYFRKGKLHKFFATDQSETAELDFFAAAKMLEADEKTKKEKVGDKLHDYLERNKKEFEFATTEEAEEASRRGGRDSATAVVRILRANEIRSFKGYTDEDELYIEKVIKLLSEGAMPKQTSKVLKQELDTVLAKEINPLKVLAVLKTNIPSEFFREMPSESAAQTAGPREVILSEYLVAKK